MRRIDGDVIYNVLAGIFWGGLIVVLFAPQVYRHFETACQTEPIPIAEEIVESSDLDKGEERITEGKEGTRQICSNGNGTVTSDTVAVAMVPRIITQGTRINETPYVPLATYDEPELEWCPVTTCNDGTCSYSTGRGTCSHHGGVWKYN